MNRNAVTAVLALCCIAALSLLAAPGAVQAESTILTGKIMNLVTRSPTTHFHGILEEILLEHKHRNPGMSWPIFDSILWEKAAFQEGLDLYLNTHVTGVVSEPISQTPSSQGSARPDAIGENADGYSRRIQSLQAVQMTTEKEFLFTADIFVDATGDGFVGALAGADAVIGRESKEQLGEADGLETADRYTMGSSLMFKARDMGKEIRFIKPFWADTYREEDMKHRPITEICSGYWWIELGGTRIVVESDAFLTADVEDDRCDVVCLCHVPVIGRNQRHIVNGKILIKLFQRRSGTCPTAADYGSARLALENPCVRSGKKHAVQERGTGTGSTAIMDR